MSLRGHSYLVRSALTRCISKKRKKWKKRRIGGSGTKFAMFPYMAIWRKICKIRQYLRRRTIFGAHSYLVRSMRTCYMRYNQKMYKILKFGGLQGIWSHKGTKIMILTSTRKIACRTFFYDLSTKFLQEIIKWCISGRLILGLFFRRQVTSNDVIWNDVIWRHNDVSWRHKNNPKTSWSEIHHLMISWRNLLDKS